jgi:flagellar assembly protein FliH
MSDVSNAVAFDLPTLEPVPGADITQGEVREDPVARATAEADAIRAAAHAEGFEAGRAEGAAQLEYAINLLTTAAADVAALRAQVCEEVETTAVEFGMRIAEQALHGAIAADPERVIDVTRGALRRLVEREHVTILVHPEDLDLVREAAPSLISQLGGIEHCEVQAERRVTRGSAIVRTVEGEVDATVATKLERAREAVAESIAAQRAAADADADPFSDVD